MRIAGVVSEFNPFHNGHGALFEALKGGGATHIVCVMSGNFVQRADFAVAEKRVRTACALACGADLVLELPVAWAVAPAQTFARGAVGVLSACGCIDTLAFGSESGSEEILRQLLEAASSPETEKKLRGILNKGNITFASARQKAVEEIYGPELSAHLGSPNDILGMEYLRAANELEWPCGVFICKRKGVSHHSREPSGSFASASYIREHIYQKETLKFIPGGSLAILQKAYADGLFPADRKKMELAVLSKLRALSRAEIENLPDISEGLENRMLSAIQKAASISELEGYLKSKRYTMARVRRLILSAFLGINKDSAAGHPPYIRLLGIGPNGGDVLSKMRNAASLPIEASLAKLSQLSGRRGAVAQLENLAADQYTLALPKVKPCGYDMTAKIVVRE